MSLQKKKPSTEVYTYDPSRVTLTFFGMTIHGFAENSFIEIQRDLPEWESVVGVDGELARWTTGSDCGRAIIKLSQSSQSNDDLSGMAIVDRLTMSMIGPFSLTDNAGKTVLISAYSFIEATPSISYDAKIGERIWVFRFGPFDSFVGSQINSKDLQ